jgi:beta-glucanase (GH16 family)
MKWERIIFFACIFIGFAIGGVICYFSYTSVSNHEYCLVLEDNFQKIDSNVWSYEIQRGGFGSGSFEWTTNDPKNAYVDSQGLHIVPTLTTETTNITLDQLTDNYVLNLTTAKTCTTDQITMCSIRSNKTAGHIINPVRSARLTTKGKKSILYGKVEVVAKMPKGSWLWPAIWMMPEKDVYGSWPRSGEIDIAESRGNFGDDYTDGRDAVISAMHWGPLPEADAFYKTAGKHNVRRTDYSESFHTFGLEWSRDYLFTYIDSRLLVSPLLPSSSSGVNIFTASFLHQIPSTLPEHVGPWWLRRKRHQQIRTLRSLVPYRKTKHPLRPKFLSHPERRYWGD